MNQPLDTREPGRGRWPRACIAVLFCITIIGMGLPVWVGFLFIVGFMYAK